MKLSLQMKNLNVKKKIENKNRFLKSFVIFVKKKNIILRIIFNFRKTRKWKLMWTLSKRRKKKYKKKSQIFRNNKQIKSESNFVCKVTITNDDEKNYLTKFLLNDVLEINVINERFLVVLNFQFINNELFASNFMNDKKIDYYEIYKIKLILKIYWQRKRIFTVIFYVIEKQNFELILKLSELK